MVFSFNRRLDPTALIKYTANLRPSWLARFYKIIHQPVHNMLMENSDRTVGKNIFLEGLELDALPGRNIFHMDDCKIWKARFRTNAGKFRNFEMKDRKSTRLNSS